MSGFYRYYFSFPSWMYQIQQNVPPLPHCAFILFKVLPLSLSVSLSLSLKLAVYKENTISPNKDFPHSKGNQLQSLNSRVLLHFTSCTHTHTHTHIYIYIYLFRVSILRFWIQSPNWFRNFFFFFNLYISMYNHYCGYLGFNGGLVENENV